MNRNVINMHSPRIERWVALSVFIAILGATGCSGDPVYGLAVTVQNAATGAPITDTAAVVIKDGAYVESYNSLGAAGLPTSGTIHAASERAGTYSITIRKTAFAPYDTAGIVVTKNACHVIPVQVLAKLSPLGAG